MKSTGGGRIVVGVCATYAGLQAIRYAVAEASRRDRPLVAVRAYRTANAELGVMFRDALVVSVAEGLARAFVAALGAIPDDITMIAVVQPGSPGRVLAAVADRPDDLIVIGGSGARRWTGRRRAAVAATCSRTAACPVVIVPPPTLARASSEARLARAAAHGVTAFLATHSGVPTG